MKVIMPFLMLLMSGVCSAALPLSDTTGKVLSIKVRNNSPGYNSFIVYMENPTRDRWQCIANSGAIVIRENGYGVSEDSYDKMFNIALAAQSSGRFLSLNSAGSDPCNNVNGVMMHD